MGTRFKLDIRYFESDVVRTYALRHLKIQESVASAKEIQSVFQKDEGRHSPIAWYTRLLGKNYTIIKEDPTPSFVPELFTVRGNVYLDGYWQSEQYFHDIAEIIRTEFEMRSVPNEDNQRLLHIILDTNSVCIHMRRTDYVTNTASNLFHGSLPLKYYLHCVRIIQEHVQQPHFFLFSDDPPWTGRTIRINAPTTYVSHNPPETAYEDLRLMSRCKHFIIANSSFSWWGAWLSRNPGKIVLAPRLWFRERSVSDGHIVPRSWQKVDVAYEGTA